MSNDRVDPKEFEKRIDETIQLADDLQRTYAKASQLAGYTRDSLQAAKDYWISLADESTREPSILPITASGVAVVNSLYNELNMIGNQGFPPNPALHFIAGTVDTFMATTHTLSSVVTVTKIDDVPYQPNPFSENPQKPTNAERLANIDAELGNTYQQIWESLYGTRSDPERAALYLMRQSIDYLFFKLAPDDDVRASKYWKTKSENDPNQITRKERIEYAAHAHVTDSARADTLAASAKQMVDTYGALNQAHKRGELDQEKARSALLSMRLLLDEWVIALEL